MAAPAPRSDARDPGGAGGVHEVALLAYPIVLTQLSQTLMHLVDSVIVGRLGAAPLGALGFAGVWLWTVTSVFAGTATGVQTFVAQAHGRGDERACGAWAWQALHALVPAAALAVFAFAALAGPLWAALGASEDVREQALTYTRMRPLGLVGQMLWLVLVAFFRGLGDTRTPLVATLVANAANALLAYGLVLGRLGLPELGVAGAGLATSLSEWVGALIVAAAFLRPGVREHYGTLPVRPDARAIRRFLRTGAPIGGQWLLDMSAFALSVAALFLLAPGPLMRMYSADPAVLALGPPLLALAALFQLCDAMHLVAAGALRGAGDTRWPFVAQTLLAWLVRLPLAWLFAVTLGGGVVGAWCAELCFIASLAVALVGRFRAGVWRTLRV